MVFSQTNVNTRQLLKLVEINRLNSEKNQQVNGPTGVPIGGILDSPSPTPVPSTSFSEEFLKPEPLFPETMFHDSDGEFFQDLVQWCAAPAEEPVVQFIDPLKVSEERAHKTDTLNTQFSPQGWELFDANSPPAPAPLAPAYPATVTDGHNNTYIDYFSIQSKNNIPFQEQFVDINELPVVIGDLASEHIAMDPPADAWQDYTYTKHNTHDTMPFIQQDDSMDLKLNMVSVIPREVEGNDRLISEYVLDPGFRSPAASGRRGLSVDVHAPALPDIISTPDVLSFVEQLEREKTVLPSSNTNLEPVQPTIKESPSVDHSPSTTDYYINSPKSEPHEESDDDTPKKAGRKRTRHDSEESDETYIPYKEHHHTPKKYRPRKPSIPIKDMIKALEGAQKDAPKSRRGRPPKTRRDSTVSTVSNNSAVSTHEVKYRELRDKNNEASKKSRMNRKLKELQMEQLADDLEEKNKKLRVQAVMLTQRINELRKTFMLAVSQQKVG